jgi:hypothetical protein
MIRLDVYLLPTSVSGVVPFAAVSVITAARSRFNEVTAHVDLAAMELAALPAPERGSALRRRNRNRASESRTTDRSDLQVSSFSSVTYLYNYVELGLLVGPVPLPGKQRVVVAANESRRSHNFRAGVLLPALRCRARNMFGRLDLLRLLLPQSSSYRLWTK